MAGFSTGCMCACVHCVGGVKVANKADSQVEFKKSFSPSTVNAFLDYCLIQLCICPSDPPLSARLSECDSPMGQSVVVCAEDGDPHSY